MVHDLQSKGAWANYWEAVRRSIRREPFDRYSVTALSTALLISLDSCRGRGRIESWSIPWIEISAVVTLKADNVSSDTIWVAIHTQEPWAEDGGAVAFPDESEGWLPTLEALPRHLPGCEGFESWNAEVALPAFAEDGRIIFYRASA